LSESFKAIASLLFELLKKKSRRRYE